MCRALVDPRSGRTAVELQLSIGVVDHLGDRLGIPGRLVDLEGFAGDLGLVDALRVIDVLVAANAAECADFSSATGTLIR